MANSNSQTTGSRDMSQCSRRSHPRERGGQREKAWPRVLCVGTDCFKWKVTEPSSSGHIGKTRAKPSPHPQMRTWQGVGLALSKVNIKRTMGIVGSLGSSSFCFFFPPSSERPAHHLGGLVWMALQTPGQIAIFQLKHRVS